MASKGDAPVEKSDEEKFTFFWQSQSPFSQWHPSEFKIDGITFCCCEQYMMYQKAILFGDDEAAQKILDTSEPREQKAIGRTVRNFDDKVWKENCRDIVKRGNKAKFTQNEDLKEKLMSTIGTTLVEASPRDRIWGIGLGASNPKALNRKTWRGTNWLGQAITEVREEILASSDPPLDV
ncbi:PREDICTED: uncharacterized protein LOC100638431 [Amphimedon queenslandica]|uniref:NADAR domain-containing protein n=1 Tax=Amphimedon queenslandica TaxID=400682 RepID=A0A1X7UIZ4_AMPQE|nr:PREDICTED: uncharacterized protein LOC100638431 [Amphimedon queenslandica]|eukprot:XP_019853895.1 PREDICTED: uncharacterized protein LOC100638431 [Amphimedon queenslandica]